MIFWLLLIGQTTIEGQDPVAGLDIQPPAVVCAVDNPNDEGNRLLITWTLSPDDARLAGYQVEREREDSAGFRKVTFVGPGVSSITDEEVVDEYRYRYRVKAIRDADTVASAPSAYARSSPQWFHSGRVNILIALVLFTALVVWFVTHARRGGKLFIRRIAGLDAVEEALGRATEMGRPILYVSGIGDMSMIGTIAALNILGEVARRTAQYNTPLIVPNIDPIVYSVAREVVKEAYTEVGRPDAFNPDSVYYITDAQFAYAAAIDGIMVREQPATNFLMGSFFAESLIMAETGASTGAVQIAGTDQVTQLPFFVTACDYTLLGEELFAASAYLAREPLLLGAIKAQDYAKAAIIVLIIVATVLAFTTGIPVESWF